MPTEPTVRYTINNEMLHNEKLQVPPIANDDEFDEYEHDEVDGEFTPLTDGIDDSFVVLRRGNRRQLVEVKNRTDLTTERRIVPAGYFPQWPGFYPEGPQGEAGPSLNLYQQKKSMAQGMLDLALLSANANQLRYVLDSSVRNHYYYVSLSLISVSLVLQVLVAIALIFKSRYNIDNEQEYANADKINNFIMIGILLITISNVVSSAFAPQN